MKIFSSLRIFALLALGLMAVAARVEAQDMWLHVTASANPVGISNNLTFTITVTNLTDEDIAQVVVTNTMPATAQFVSVSFGLVPYPYTNTGANVIFNVGVLTNNGIAQMAVTVEPTATGYITNTVVVVTNGVVAIVGPVPIQVTNAMPVADLAVAMTGPSSEVFTNDYMTYGVNVTNLGPASASNVMLTNTLPSFVGFKTNSPSSQIPSVQGSNVIFNLGTLASGAFINFQLTVQPTNAGTLTFVSVVGTNGVIDLNPTNNTATNTITVTNYFPASLEAFTNSAQIIDFQNALTEQSIAVSNAGPSLAYAVRVVVTGLTNRLFNAVGTNNGNPFVVYSSALDTNRSMNLLLQFYPRSYFPFTNGQLHAFAVSVPNLAPPPVTAVSTNINISRIVQRSDGSMLLIWPSTLGQAYTVVYSDNVLFSNARIAPPSVVAPANQTPWIDYGPPTTVSQPTNSTARFYRIYLNP